LRTMRRRDVFPPATLPPGEERLVSHRLRTLIQLAITIGRREDLLGNGPPAEDNCAGSAGESCIKVPQGQRGSKGSCKAPS